MVLSLIYGPFSLLCSITIRSLNSWQEPEMPILFGKSRLQFKWSQMKLSAKSAESAQFTGLYDVQLIATKQRFFGLSERNKPTVQLFAAALRCGSSSLPPRRFFAAVLRGGSSHLHRGG
jgi:hypothetical protein